MGIHLDTDVIYLGNQKKEGVTRKNGCIINTGKNPTNTERTRKIEENRRRYQLSTDKVDSIQLPKRELEQDVNVDAMKDRLKFLRERLSQYEKRLQQLGGSDLPQPEPAKVKLVAAPAASSSSSLPRISDFIRLKTPEIQSSPAPNAPVAAAASSTPPTEPKPKKAAAKRTAKASSAASPKTTGVRLPARYAKPPPGSGATVESWREIMIALSPDEREQLLQQYYGGMYDDDVVEEDDDFEERHKKKKKRKPAPTTTSTSTSTRKRKTQSEIDNKPNGNDDMEVDGVTTTTAAPAAPAAAADDDDETQMPASSLHHQEFDDNMMVDNNEMDPILSPPQFQDTTGGDMDESVFDLGY